MSSKTKANSKKATAETPDKADKQRFDIQLDDWLNDMRQLEAWQTASLGQDYEQIAVLLTEIVQGWPFDGDPGNAMAYGELLWDDFLEVYRAVNDEVARAWAGLDEVTLPKDQFEVDVSPWMGKAKHHMRWNRAARQLHVILLVGLMSEVVQKWPFKGEPDDPSAYEDLTPAEFKTLQKAVADVLSRKFRR